MSSDGKFAIKNTYSIRESSVRVKTVAVYLRVSTQLAQRQASTPVDIGQWLRKFYGLLMRLALPL